MKTHAYKPRKITVDRLPISSNIRLDWRAKRSGFSAKPCDTCGGSKSLLIHGLPKTYVPHDNPFGGDFRNVRFVPLDS